jgi:mRNA interferase MazF
MKRGELWLAAIDKMRPVLILSTFTGLNHIQVIPVTTRVRGLATEVFLGRDDGLHDDCVLNAQQLQLVPAAALSVRISHLDPQKMFDVCKAVNAAIGC